MKKLSFVFIFCLLTLVGCVSETDVTVDELDKMEDLPKVEFENVMKPIVDMLDNNVTEPVDTNVKDEINSVTLEPTISAQQFLDSVRDLVPFNSTIEVVRNDGYNQIIITSTDNNRNFLINFLILPNAEDFEYCSTDLKVVHNDTYTVLEQRKGNVSLLLDATNDLYDTIYDTVYVNYFENFSEIVSNTDWDKLDLPLLTE